MWITFWPDRRKILNTWEKIRNVDNVDNHVDNLIIASLNAGKWEITGFGTIGRAIVVIECRVV